MAKKKDETSQLLDGMIASIKSQISGTGLSTIPDIITFCEDPHYLNITENIGNPIILYPLQKIVLKVFYRGTEGNEKIKLASKEIELLKEEKMDYILDKYDSGNIFRECVLVWGRRSGKDLLCSLIALYETMRLLEIPGGNPFTYYGIKEGNPIHILTVASSSSQAEILFNEIKTTLISSPYFQDKIGWGGKAIESSSIHLLTPADKKRNEELKKKGIEPTKGSVVILAGHSNSDTLRGKRTFILLLDEVATYGMTSGASGGEAIYNSLAPSTNDFRIYYEEDGVKKDKLDSKIISISSPRGKEGIFWRLYRESFDKELGSQRFAMKASTWKVNLRHSRESCRRDFPFMTEQEFSMEFGAEFAGLEGEKFIADEYIDKAINMDLGQREVGIRGVFYFGHLDPASTSHNYAFVILHVEDFVKLFPVPGTDKQRKERTKRFVVDHVKVWTPTANRSIDFQEVDRYVIDISKRFKFIMVSYDAFESRQSMQNLRQNGVPVKLTQFRKRYKVEVYKYLENLLISGNLVLPGHGPHAKLMEMELKSLKRKWTPGGGFKIMANPDGEVQTDDVCDSLSGACGIAMNNVVSGLAKPETVYMPVLRDQENIWRIGQGTYSKRQFDHLNRSFGYQGRR